MIQFSGQGTCVILVANIYNSVLRRSILFIIIFPPTTSVTLQTMHPPPSGQAAVSSPLFPSEPKSRGVHFSGSTQLTESPESYEKPLPSETGFKILGLSALPNSPAHPLLDRVPMVDPRLQMIKRRSQCEMKLSPLCSLRQTMRVPFPESSPYAPTNFTPNWTPFPVRSHPLGSGNCLLTVVNRWELSPARCLIDSAWITLKYICRPWLPWRPSPFHRFLDLMEFTMLAHDPALILWNQPPKPMSPGTLPPGVTLEWKLRIMLHVMSTSPTSSLNERSPSIPSPESHNLGFPSPNQNFWGNQTRLTHHSCWENSLPELNIPQSWMRLSSDPPFKPPKAGVCSCRRPSITIKGRAFSQRTISLPVLFTLSKPQGEAPVRIASTPHFS